MTDDDRRKNVLQFVMLFAAVGWGLSFLFVFWNWDSAIAALQLMGGRSLAFDPFLYYWMRVIGAIFGCFGVFCVVLAMRPGRYGIMVPWVGWIHVVAGLVAGGSALSLKMEPAHYPTLLAELAFFWTIRVTLIWLSIGRTMSCLR